VLEGRRLEEVIRRAYSSMTVTVMAELEKKVRGAKRSSKLLFYSPQQGDNNRGMVVVVKNEMNWSRLRMRWKVEGEANWRILKVFVSPKQPCTRHNDTE